MKTSEPINPANKCLYCYGTVENGFDFHEKCSLEFFGISNPPTIEYSLSQMEDLAKTIVERSIAVPGVQPKLSMSLVKGTTNNPNSRLTVIGALGGYYILKPPSDQFAEMPENESVTMRMASIFGIRVVPSSLIRLASGELSYISKRIDRTEKGEKIHMLDMFQITEAVDKYRSSMEKIGKALTNYSNNPLLDKIFLFELTIFSYLTGNNDMHLKNFSMIENQSSWILSPAYDLLNVSIVNTDDKEELALTLSGKKKKLTYKHFEQFGIELGLTQKQIEATFKRFNKQKSEALELIDKSFLSDPMKVNFKNLMESRYIQLEKKS